MDSYITIHRYYGLKFVLSQGVIRICQLPPEFTYHGRWSVRRIPQGKDISHVEFFEQHGVYALATSAPEDFFLVDEDGQPKELPDGILIRIISNLDPLEFLPKARTGMLELIHPVTMKTVDT